LRFKAKVGDQKRKTTPNGAVFFFKNEKNKYKEL